MKYDEHNKALTNVSGKLVVNFIIGESKMLSSTQKNHMILLQHKICVLCIESFFESDAHVKNYILFGVCE